jgi:hypothetical protein
MPADLPGFVGIAFCVPASWTPQTRGSKTYATGAERSSRCGALSRPQGWFVAATNYGPSSPDGRPGRFPQFLCLHRSSGSYAELMNLCRR